ncbi:hypothetical protein [Campylobacter concisus]|uniref:hypothetical protein n=1 Tax=Campylobacter concisus TaxID=199 RepID=UPI0015E198D9|nr:hypothetical protein [Campylobacter concisus]
MQKLIIFIKKVLFLSQYKFYLIINRLLNTNASKKIILLLDSKNQNIIFIRYIFGALTIVGNRKSYKIEINRNSLAKELFNREYIKNNYIEVYDILLPLKIKRKFGFMFLESNTIQNIYQPDFKLAYEYVRRVFENSTLESVDIAYFENILDSIQFISRSNNEFNVLKKIFIKILETEKYLVPSHGDFHIGNILKNNNRYYLIDLDCFRRFQFVWMDEIYFVVELIVFEKKNINWLEVVKQIIIDSRILIKYKEYFKYFNFENPYAQLLIYLLDRLEQEKKHINYNLGNIYKIIDLIIGRLE